MYKAVLVGCGGRAAAHIEAYQHIPNARVVACCAPTSTRREPLAARYGLRSYSDTAEMIRTERPDIVHLVLWPETRVEMMTLIAGLDVPLCTVEKPIATGVQDWRRLRQLEAASSTRFAVCHQVRWQPHLVKCRQAVSSGRIGAPMLLHMSSGMNIAGQGTHTLNYGRSLAGDPAVVRVFGAASGWETKDPGHPGPDTTSAQLEFDNGLRALWTTGVISPRAGDPATTWQHVRVAAYGERGRVVYEEFGKWQVVGPDVEDGGDFGGMDGWRTNNILAQAGFHRAMFHWLEDDRNEPGTSLRQSLHEWAVVLAVYQSVVERRPVEMTESTWPDDLIARYRQEVPALAGAAATNAAGGANGRSR